jgi:beta-glucosidase
MKIEVLKLRCFLIPMYVLLLLVSSSATALSADNAIEERINTLIHLMTLEEKIAQLNPADRETTADNDRLEIPGFYFADGPHGVRVGVSTCFPVSIAMAATWDVDLVERIGVAMGKEHLAKGVNTALAPSIDLVRDPEPAEPRKQAGRTHIYQGKWVLN